MTATLNNMRPGMMKGKDEYRRTATIGKWFQMTNNKSDIEGKTFTSVVQTEGVMKKRTIANVC
jgi:hypothetical protein